MERCVWSFHVEDGLIVLGCDFSPAPFSTSRKMQIVYESAGAFSSVLRSKNLPCFIGIGPAPNTDEVQDALWQIVLMPDTEHLPEQVQNNHIKALRSEVEAFCLHLNQNPRSHLLDPNQTSSTTLN